MVARMLFVAWRFALAQVHLFRVGASRGRRGAAAMMAAKFSFFAFISFRTQKITFGFIVVRPWDMPTRSFQEFTQNFAFAVLTYWWRVDCVQPFLVNFYWVNTFLVTFFL